MTSWWCWSPQVWITWRNLLQGASGWCSSHLTAEDQFSSSSLFCSIYWNEYFVKQNKTKQNNKTKMKVSKCVIYNSCNQRLLFVTFTWAKCFKRKWFWVVSNLLNAAVSCNTLLLQFTAFQLDISRHITIVAAAVISLPRLSVAASTWNRAGLDT